MAFTTTYFAVSYSEAMHAVAALHTVDQFEPEAPATYLSACVEGDPWGGSVIDGIRATAFVLESPVPNTLIGDRGEVWTVKGGKVLARARLPDSGLEGRHLGQPNDIRRIGGQLYVCGFAGQIYTQDPQGAWIHMDDGVAEAEGNAGSIDLESIDGTAADDLYTVGSGGLVFHFNGKRWTQIPVATNVYLARVRCFARDRIVIVGQQGVVIEGNGTSSWRTSRIAQAKEDSLSDVALFQGKVYVAAVDRLLVQTATGWQVVKTGLPKSTQFVRLVVGGEKLWAMGYKRVHSFDGKKWTAHPDANNG